MKKNRPVQYLAIRFDIKNVKKLSRINIVSSTIGRAASNEEI